MSLTHKDLLDLHKEILKADRILQNLLVDYGEAVHDCTIDELKYKLTLVKAATEAECKIHEYERKRHIADIKTDKILIHLKQRADDIMSRASIPLNF